MPYIPRDWIKDKKNELTIHEILNKFLNSDINLDIDLVVKELKDIGETVIADKIMDGILTVD
jgi:hypothetical protein